MIFVDTNVFIYSAGAEHPHKNPSRRFILRVARGEVDAFTSAEVLQEILHRYKAIQRLDEGAEIYYLVRKVMRSVTPITAALVDEACLLLVRHDELSARDALHAATSLAVGAEAICSYDRAFDRIPTLERREPVHYL